MGLGHRLGTVPAPTPEDRRHHDGVYLQLASRMTFEGSALTLVDLSPSTVYVGAGDPWAIGYLSTGDFLDRWASWQREHHDRQARGVLSLLDASARFSGDTHVSLHAPRIKGSGLEYRVERQQGVLPAASGSCVLLIEPHWER